MGDGSVFEWMGRVEFVPKGIPLMAGQFVAYKRFNALPVDDEHVVVDYADIVAEVSDGD